MADSLSNEIYPILCRPIFKAKIWGGRRLEELYGKPLPEGEKIGESWEVADLPEGASLIGNGPLEGQSLSDAVRLWGKDLIGRAWRPGRFPLLVKLLDAHDDLSVQTHPSAEDCREHFPEHKSKDESWIVLDTDADASVLHGFKEGATLEEFHERLKAGTVVEMLRRVEVRPGNVLRVDPGTVHALCRGVVLLEIQQPSNSTFRIYDYDRPGDDGKPRTLHLDEAGKVLRFDVGPALLATRARGFSWGNHELLVECPAYRIERFDVRGVAAWTVNPVSAQALIVVQGGARLESGETGIDLKAGDVVILPAKLGRVSLTCSELSLFVLAGAPGVTLMSSAVL